MRFHRAIGVVIFGAALLGAVLLGAAIALTSPGARSRPDDGLLFGVWKVVYDTEAPSPRVVMAAFGLALVAAAGVAFLERRISSPPRSSRSSSTRCSYLSDIVHHRDRRTTNRSIHPTPEELADSSSSGGA